jgi:glucose-1-phosphate cytidylyltransferase
MEIHHSNAEPWRVTLIDTGYDTGTGGRLRRIRSFLGDEDFCFTYGDGLSNIDILDLISFHKSKKTLATVTTVLPASRYGVFALEKNNIIAFDEKPKKNGGWINGGFFVLSPKVVDFIDGDETHWEHSPMKSLVSSGQLSAYLHRGFWHPMDTLRDKNRLEEMWNSGKAPWKIW